MFGSIFGTNKNGQNNPNSTSFTYSMTNFRVTTSLGFPKKFEGRIDKNVFYQITKEIKTTINEHDMDGSNEVKGLNKKTKCYLIIAGVLLVLDVGLLLPSSMFCGEGICTFGYIVMFIFGGIFGIIALGLYYYSIAYSM